MKHKSKLAVLLAVVLGAGADARGEFVPGMIYVADSGSHFCFYGPSLIWEVNPETGESRVLVSIPADEGPCPYFLGLRFTPDGSRLRGAALLWDTIEEIDPEGNLVTVYDASDGLWAPRYIAYDAAGNFYVNDAADLLRFPEPDGGAPELIADFYDGMRSASTIDFAADGDLYVAPGGDGPILESQDYLIRFTPPDWTVSIFDDDFSSMDEPTNIVGDGSGYVYLHWQDTIFRYRAGDPDSRVVLSDGEVWPFGMALAADERSLIAHTRRLLEGELVSQVVAIDVLDGAVETLAVIEDEYFGDGSIAVVPANGPPGDADVDGDVDAADFARYQECFSGPEGIMMPGCGLTDLDDDVDVDFADFGLLQRVFTGPGGGASQES